MDIDEVRRENMRAIETEMGGPTEAAAKVGMSAAQWTNLRDGARDSKTGKQRGMRKETARKIESGASKPPGWLDVDHSELGDRADIKALVDLPLVGEIKGGPDGFLEELNYPVGHGEGVVQHSTSDPMAYALRVRGDSMHPRYRAGEFVIVEPSIDPQQGDDVVVLCKDGRKLLKELGWKRDGEVNLRSINNGYEPITLRLDEIESIQLAAGRARRSALKRL